MDKTGTDEVEEEEYEEIAVTRSWMRRAAFRRLSFTLPIANPGVNLRPSRSRICARF